MINEIIILTIHFTFDCKGTLSQIFNKQCLNFNIASVTKVFLCVDIFSLELYFFSWSNILIK